MKIGKHDGLIYDDFTQFMIHFDTVTGSYLNEEIIDFPALTHVGIVANTFSPKFNNCLQGTGGGTIDGQDYPTQTNLFNSFFPANGDYTVECRFRCVLGYAGSVNLWGPNAGSGPSIRGSDGRLSVYNGVTNVINNSFWPGDSLMHHFAMVYHSGLTSFYLDGVSGGSSATFFPIQLGAVTNNLYFSGGDSTCFYDELRISNIARWTANFTPPTVPYGVVPDKIMPMPLRTPLVLQNHARSLPNYGKY